MSLPKILKLETNESIPPVGYSISGYKLNYNKELPLKSVQTFLSGNHYYTKKVTKGNKILYKFSRSQSWPVGY